MDGRTDMGYDDMIFQWIVSLAILTISTFFALHTMVSR